MKLLGPHDPELPLPPIKLELSRFSKSAAEAVRAAGGEVVAVYKNRLGLRREVWPEKSEGKDAAPVRKADISKLRPYIASIGSMNAGNSLSCRILFKSQEIRLSRSWNRSI